MASVLIDSQADIPDAARYVTMRDTFLSGWGQAEGRAARFVAVCDSQDEAEVVAANAQARGDQVDVEIHDTLPALDAGSRWGLMTRDGNSPWWTPGNWGGD